MARSAGLDEDKLWLLVMIGVRADGRRELAALADGYREPAESRADLLRDCARRGEGVGCYVRGEVPQGRGQGHRR